MTTVETHCWPLADMLVTAVEDDTGLTTIALTVTVQDAPAGPGDALVALVRALAAARLTITPQEPAHD